MPDALHVQMEEARAGLYDFFSQALLQEPTETWLRRIMSEQVAGPLQETFADPEYRRELEQLRLDFREGRLTAELACLDFEALLRIPSSGYLSPYESVYRPQGADGSARGSLCGAATLTVERLYLQEGLEPVPEFSNLPDHAGVELEFMAYLCRKTATALKANSPQLAAEYRGKQRQFLLRHLSPWVARLARRLEIESRTSYFRFLGVFLQLFLQLEDDLYGQTEREMAARTPGADHLGQEMRP
ncbi:MAG: molecular chaperone TorD family protein [Deltaproteobacteria bacterium]|nr:molecular chaperone TorD family protein [Deltaproteobacteria bacterium]